VELRLVRLRMRGSIFVTTLFLMCIIHFISVSIRPLVHQGLDHDG
jgi:hypothetical protein